ncbi:MAG: capsule assembly Wzi family protein, partial [Burkholderiales bacterium]
MPLFLFPSFTRGTLAAALILGLQGPAAGAPSVPWTPSWEARHHLQRLVDGDVIRLTTTHWPLPAAAVERALAAARPTTDASLARSLSVVKDELTRARTQGRIEVQARNAAEGLTAFGESYTPGSSLSVRSAASQAGPFAWRLGARLEQNANSLQTQFSGLGTEGRWQARLEDSALVLGLSEPWTGGNSGGAWNAQVFSQRFWWGPGWQQSLVLGHNAPALNGIGLQRGSAEASSSRWLSWMGPWNLDVFVARAQDPIVVAKQPDGFLYSGMRLTMQPWPWLEIGLSRGFQAGGTGRPSGVRNFVKAFFGQEV